MAKKIKNLLLLCCCLWLLGLPTSVHAQATKQTTLDLPREYVAATFHISSEEFDLRECQIQVISPHGNRFELEEVSYSSAQISINNLEQGKWTILLTSDTLEEIGTIHLRVEGSKSDLASGDSEIEVAANITGLKTYMKDDAVVVEWNDTSIPVTIDVMDSKTMQVLDSVKMGAKDAPYYEHKIPSSVSEILVHVTPSSSVSIQGTTNSYTMEVYNNPNAKMVFPSNSHTNQDSISFVADLEEAYQLSLVVNGKEKERTSLLPAGEHEYHFPVSSGENDYKVYVIDDKGYMKSYPLTIVGDFVAPQLLVDLEQKQITTSENLLSITGTVTDCDFLTVNGKTVENRYDDGVFEYEYTLHEGENKIEVIASDLAGNEVIYPLVVTYEIPKSNPLLPILGIIAAIIIAGVALFLKKRTVVSEETAKKEEKSSQRQKRERKGSFLEILFGSKKSAYSWIFTPIVLLLSLFILLHFLIAQILISSSSMEPTMFSGDLVFFNRLAYVDDEVKRGDVICFWSDEEDSYIGKRVIGLPGEEITFLDGFVQINGVYLDESLYVMEDSETNCDKTFVVPDGSYFVLGDNREVSKDSRHFQNPYISKDSILGKYMGSSGINIHFFID